MYEVPDWSALPQQDYALEVIKDGTVVAEIPLKGKEYFILGRQADAVDILMEHPSVSRRHAVLNFRKDGALMLNDLNSAQGTVINKKMCTKGDYHKLNVGDVMKFAASTRLYVVKGPDELQPIEYVSENLEKLRQKSEENMEKWKRQQEKKQNMGVSWGMDSDDEEDTSSRKDLDKNEDNRSRKDKKFDQLPEYLTKDENYDRKYGEQYTAAIQDDEARNPKDHVILEKIRKKEKKIQNMQEENKRIYMKEYSQDSGLTDGQVAAVSRNDKNIARLSEEIDTLVRQIKIKNAERDGITAPIPILQKRKLDDTADELLDTSAETADTSTNWRLKKKLNKSGGMGSFMIQHGGSIGGKSTGGVSLGYEEIQDALTQCQQRQAVLQTLLSDANNHIDQLHLAIHTLKGKEDDVEVVIKEDQLRESQVMVKAHLSEEKVLKDRISQLQNLLSIAAPAIKSLIKSRNKIISSTNAIGRLSSTAESQSTSALASTSMLFIEGEEDIDGLEAFKKFVGEEKVREEQETKAVKQNARRSEKLNKIAPGVVEEESSKQRELSEKALSNVEYDTKEVMAAEKKKAASVKGPTAKTATKATTVVTADSKVLQGGDLVWIPPKSQKGDGRTALNDKFGY